MSDGGFSNLVQHGRRCQGAGQSTLEPRPSAAREDFSECKKLPGRLYGAAVALVDQEREDRKVAGMERLLM